MDSNSDENKNQSHAVDFDSKNIVRGDNSEMFTRIEGAKERAKKAAEEKARIERGKIRLAKKIEQNKKRDVQKIKSAQRNAHLKAVLWEGKHKRRTIIIAGIILVAILAYPAYLGGSALISAIISKVQETEERKEEEKLAALPPNYAYDVFQELTNKYREEGFESGEEYFEAELAKVENNNELMVRLYISHATAIENEFQTEHIDAAIESALRAEELDPSEETASKLHNLYYLKGDSGNAQKYKDLYLERLDQSTGGIG